MNIFDDNVFSNSTNTPGSPEVLATNFQNKVSPGDPAKPVSNLAVAVLTGRETDTRVLQLWDMLLAAVEQTGLVQQGARATTAREWGLTTENEFFAEAKALVVDSEGAEPLQAGFRLVLHSQCTVINQEWELKVSVSRVSDGPYALPIAARYLKLTSSPYKRGQAIVVETYFDAKGVQANPWVPTELNFFLADFSESLLDALSA